MPENPKPCRLFGPIKAKMNINDETGSQAHEIGFQAHEIGFLYI